MQRAAGGFDYRLRLVVPDLQPIDELEPASCTRKCLAAETLRGHSAECGGFARPLQAEWPSSKSRPDALSVEGNCADDLGDKERTKVGVHKASPNEVLFVSPAGAS